MGRVELDGKPVCVQTWICPWIKQGCPAPVMPGWWNVQLGKLHLISYPWKVPVFLVSLSCSYCVTLRQRNEQIYLYLTCLLLLNYCGLAATH